MIPIPEWAPAVHPLIVHFPLALLFAAAGVDVAALILPRWPWLRFGASGLYAVGAASAVVAFYTGRSAADGAMLPAAADPVLTGHATWAARTAWYYGVYGLARVAREWRYPARLVAAEVAAVVLGLAGLPLLAATGEHGAQLVYQHGVGVQAVAVEGASHDHDAHGEVSSPEPADDHADGHKEGHADGHEGVHERTGSRAAAVVGSALQEAADGSWAWATPTGAQGGPPGAEWLWGTPEAVAVEVITEDREGGGLVLQAARPALWVAGEPLGNVQVQLRLRLDDWRGTVAIVHHAVDKRTFDALRLRPDSIALVRTREGQTAVLDQAQVDLRGWHSVRLVADGSHLRGYADDKLLVHGHADAGAPGRVGLQLEGVGRVGVGDMKVMPSDP